MAARVSQGFIEVLTDTGGATLRVSQGFIEVLNNTGGATLRVSQGFIEVLISSFSPVRVSQGFIEVLRLQTEVDVSYSTPIVIGQTYARDEMVTYTTTFDALSYIDGEIVVNPTPSEVAHFTTTIIIGQTYSAGDPILVVYSTPVVFASNPTISSQVRYTTRISFGQREATAIDGRVDLLGNLRYRR